MLYSGFRHNLTVNVPKRYLAERFRGADVGALLDLGVMLSPSLISFSPDWQRTLGMQIQFHKILVDEVKTLGFAILEPARQLQLQALQS